MNKKSLNAGLLILSIGVAGIAEAGEHVLDAEADRTTTLEPGSSGSLCMPPHSHLEPFDDSVPNTVNEIFASGGQASLEKFRLHIVPLGSGGRLVGYPFASPAGDRQMMYGTYENVDSLRGLLSLVCPPNQVETLCRAADQGQGVEIGGHSHSAIRLFSRAALEAIGMSFHLPT